MPLLSVVIVGRKEQFFDRTVADAVAHIRGDTEVIGICDEGWPEPAVADDPKVHLVCHPTSIGQRAAVNEGVRISRAKYVMKADAHCSFDEGFDVKATAPYEDGRLDQRTTSVLRMYNLHAFDWLCKGCGKRIYQGKKPEKCETCQSVDVVQDIIWKPRLTKQTDFARFDSDLHFQYFGEYKARPAAQGDFADLMCCVGACWMLPKSFYEEFGGMDEAHGSWGQMGVELACKSWLSGGRQVVNKTTWFSHMFRTQPGFGFPYPISGNQVENARKHSRKLWMGNTWPQQVRPLSWLIQKFSPVPSWTDDLIQTVSGKGKQFAAGDVAPHQAATAVPAGSDGPMTAPPPPDPIPPAWGQGRAGAAWRFPTTGPGPRRTQVTGKAIKISARTPLTKGLLYYTHNEGDPLILKAAQARISHCAQLHSIEKIVSVSLRPIDFGDNIVLPLQKGTLTMFQQQLRGLEALVDVDVVFFVEHDVLYHPDHFAFDPPRNDVFYYDENVWKIDARDIEKPLFYFAKQTAQLCASRELLLGHYQKRVAKVEKDGFSRHMGFEPGCHMPPRGVDSFPAMRWMSPNPQLDIRWTGQNLTKSRWDQKEFRSPQSCLGWTLADDVPGWPRIFGRFPAFIHEVAGGA
jgi:hypothetical protein